MTQQRFSGLFIAIMAVAALLVTAPDAEAKKRARKSSIQDEKALSEYFESRKSEISIDAKTGKILFQKNAYKPRYPASLTKMMTLYLTFEALKSGALSLNTDLEVSAFAAGQQQTNLSLEPGERITVEEAVLGLVIRSANDAAVVLAEALGGSEDRFARKMTMKARQLGLTGTTFKNASGLHDPEQVTTARDMALLGLALQKHFPEYYRFFSRTSFTVDGRLYTTHNRVVLNYPGADGLKTGYVRTSGFNIVSSARKFGKQVIAVVMGGITASSRDEQVMALLDRSFAALGSDGTSNVASEEKGEEEKFNVPPVKEPVNLDNAAVPAALTSPANPKVFKKVIARTSEQAEKPLAARPLLSQVPSPKSKPARKQETAREGKTWGIQIGAFDGKKEAMKAAAKAMKKAPRELSGSRIKIGKDKNLHRALIANLTRQQAQLACQKLARSNESCFVYRVKSG